MRYVGSEGYSAKRNFLVSAFDAEFTVGKINVGVTCFHEVGCNFLGLGFNLVEGTHDGRAANRNRA